LLRGLEQAHRSALAYHVHRITRLGSSVLISGTWYQELQRIGKAADDEAREKSKGLEVGYELFSINGKMLGHGDPIRVKQGDRVLFHILNASAGEIRSLALPGHVFRVIALDGNPVPVPADAPVLWLGTAERISAIVEMKHPGVWVMGDLADDDRGHGMGIIVEYGGQKSKSQWIKPKPYRWDYTLLAKLQALEAQQDKLKVQPAEAPTLPPALHPGIARV
jgi:FtsP/CotA-like multicopper oxidase with cupredoxin domain